MAVFISEPIGGVGVGVGVGVGGVDVGGGGVDLGGVGSVVDVGGVGGVGSVVDVGGVGGVDVGVGGVVADTPKNVSNSSETKSLNITLTSNGALPKGFVNTGKSFLVIVNKNGKIFVYKPNNHKHKLNFKNN